jgi:hypothetical protein
MRECPKCKSHYGDEVKICRTCGAILGAVADEPPRAVEDAPVSPEAVEDSPASPEDDVPSETTASSRSSWKCSQCGQSVPGDFEVCWNCGTSQDGEVDPDFSKVPAEDDDNAADEAEDNDDPAAERDSEPTHTRHPGLRCPMCGSSRIIPSTMILDQGQYSNGKLQVAVDAEPDALIFKDRIFGQLTADICGDCGHVELKVAGARELYEHYLRSKDESGG